MHYRAHIRFDFDKQKSNEYQKLITALLQTGWNYVQTSAVAIESSDLVPILRALDIIARQCVDAGELSGLMVDVQGSSNFDGENYKGAVNHPNAVQDVKAKKVP